MLNTDVTIIGAGPVGLFAVFQAGMLDMRCQVIDSLPVIGGQCAILYPEKPIYDIPAHPMILGQDLIDNLSKQAQPFNPSYHLNQQVVDLTKDEQGCFIITTSEEIKIRSKVVLIAAGHGAFTPKAPELANLAEYENNSVFYEVTSNSKFAGKRLVIAGGGDSAIDWAINLVDIASKIYLIHRRDKFRALPENVNKVHQLVQNGKIELMIPYQLASLQGARGQLSTVTLKTLNGELVTVDADYLLAFFGLKTNLGPINNWSLDLDKEHIIVDKATNETSVPGVYAMGDIATYPGKLKLILTGFAEAATALHHAYHTVFPGKFLHFKYSTNKGVPQHDH